MPYRNSTVNSEILAVHAALIPGGSAGRVLLFGGDEHNSAAQEPSSSDGWRKTRVYDVATGALLTDTIPSPDSDVFCAGHAFLPDGRLLIGGGTSEWLEDEDDHHGDRVHHVHGLSFGGHARCWAYNPSDNAWVETARMLPEPGRSVGGGRWYPTLLSLGTGEVIAFFGHPRFEDNRHRNTIAEKYSAIGDSWKGLPQMATATIYPSGGVRFLMYPRVFQLPDGRLFFATGMPVIDDTTHRSTFYDPTSGDYVGDPIAEPSGYGNGWDYPAVLLPLLPEENYRPRVLFAGNETPRWIDLGASPPTWQATVDRAGSVETQRRIHGMAVLLPTGKVCMVGGMDVVGSSEPNPADRTPEVPTLRAEIYDPGIDWGAGDFSGSASWSTDEDDAQHARNYHSSALLLPDGTIWIAGGNTNAFSGDPDGDVDIGNGTIKKIAIKAIEVYEPDYVAAGGRPALGGVPEAISYGQTFSATSDQAASIERAALIRFGSATHGHNYDQRYVGINFDRDGSTLHFTAPPNGNVAPPGFYMLWIVDDQGRPCEQAGIVRLGSMTCDLVLDRSTFSVFEVEALLDGGSPARIPNAVYAVFDGFRPKELGSPPTPPVSTLTFEDDGSAIPTGQMKLVYRETLLEDEDASDDIVQRVTFVYDVEFGNTSSFSGFAEQRNVRIRLSSGAHQCLGRLVLLNQPNPYMRDIDADEDNPHWLSIDTRVFQIAEGDNRDGVDQNSGGNAPRDFITGYVGELRSRPDDDSHPFLDISTDQATSKLELSRSVEGKRVFNYVVAKVRYRALRQDADNVQMFFRMFTTAATNLRYDVNGAYRRDGDWPNSVPRLGTIGGELVSLPFFAQTRVDTTSVPLTDQTDPLNHETIPAGGAGEVTMYFGAWLDFNQTTPRFPLLPGDGDGPFTGSTPLTSPKSIQELIRGQHQCLVSEIRFQPGSNDPIPPQAGPSQSDRLSQRNLAIVESDNPGGPDSRTVAHTFEIAPSPHEPRGYWVGAPLGRVLGDSPIALAQLKRTPGPDELLIRWGNFPRYSEVELFFGDLDVDEILALAATRQGPPVLRKVDGSTLAVAVGEATWIPIPGNRAQNIASLVTVRLPEGVTAGEMYTASVAQISGPLRTVLGTFQLAVPIGKAADLRAAEVRKLSVLRYIAESIPLSNRWHPVFERYLTNVEGRVREYGTDPADVAPNPDGTGKPWVKDRDDDVPGVPRDPDDPWRPGGDGVVRPDRGSYGEGRVSELVYDGCGCFRGFVLTSCEGERQSFPSSDPGIERVVRRACKNRTLVRVFVDKRRIRRISIRCC